MLKQEPPPQATPASSGDGDEEALFAECLRRAQAFLASQPTHIPHLLPPPPQTHIPDSQTAIVSSAMADTGQKRKRSSEMVRVSIRRPLDKLHFLQQVRRTRAVFESLRLYISKVEDEARAQGFWGKKGSSAMNAAALMLRQGLWLNREVRVVGPILGTRVGDVFFFRIELCVVGLHGQVQAGIDHVAAGGSATGEPIATSVVVSGGYEDDDDRGDTLIYTGHGGRAPSQLRHSLDQKLAGGNLALERSMAYGVEVRVIRGLKTMLSPSGRLYVYDGVYRVNRCWSEPGKSGFIVFKFELSRIENQPKLGSIAIKLAEELKFNMLRARPRGILALDLSSGRETLPVSVFNDVDADDAPLRFEYLPRRPSPAAGGCSCAGDCTGDGCGCTARNGGELPYDAGGALLRGRPLVHECGSHCRCSQLTCKNRVTQRGLRTRLEVFKSWERGWGVRPLEVIRAGSFVCELTGVVVVDDLRRPGMVNPNRFTPRWAEWGNLTRVLPNYHPPPACLLPPLEFALDVSRGRNVACYLARSHSPNVFVQLVVRGHDGGPLQPHLMVFALESIPPMRELSVDYGVGEGWTVVH
ncbi:histone-lysine N-methyltransferase family member SUVH9-like [Wolffia australiana]